MIIISLSCSSENSQREPKVHGKGYKGLILELVLRLPSLGDSIQPSEHQHFTALCNIQLSCSQPLAPLWYLINLFSLAVGLTGGAKAPTVAAPQLLVSRSSMGWARRSTCCGASLQGKADSMEKSQHELPVPGCVAHELLYRHQNNLYQNALT